MSFFRKGNEYFYKGKYEDAVDSYRAAIEISDDVPLYYSNLGWAYEKLGQIKNARDAYLKAAAGRGLCVRGSKCLSSTLCHEPDFELELLSGVRDAPVLEDEKRARDSVEKIKRKYFHLGLQESATSDFNKLISGKNKAKRIVASVEFALILLNQERSDNFSLATELLENSRKVDPGFYTAVQYSVLLAEAYRLSGDELRAKEEIGSTSKLCPDNHDLLFAKANEEASIEARLAIVNRIYKESGLGSIALKGAAGELYNLLKMDHAEKLPVVNGGPLVSIIVPAFNAEGTIHVALDSLLVQTWKNIEVIVVDDCSTDNTRDIVSEYVDLDDRVKLLSTGVNSGPYVARNIALGVCRGELVTCNDADDWSHAQKIEAQASYLLNNPSIVAASSRQVRATPEICFHRRGNLGFYLFDNMSSLMFRKNLVLSELGCWDSVRFGADSEFIKRMKLVFGVSSIVTMKTAPMSFQRQAETSLTGNKTFGFHGSFFGARLEYKLAQENYHAKKRSLLYPFPMKSRPFSVPEPMRPSREVDESKFRHFDVIIGSEFRMNGGSVMSNIEEIKANARAGLKTGIVQLSRFDQNPKDKVLPAVREVVDAGLAEMIVFGENVTCDLFILRYPPCMQEMQSFVPHINATHINVVVNQPPMSDYGSDPEFRYSLRTVQGNIEKQFGSNVTWYPIGPLVRDALHKHHHDELSAINLSDDDWLNIVDVDVYGGEVRTGIKGIPKIGRHARGYKWIKWPANSKDLLAVYPDDERYEVRILGGAKVPQEMLGTLPNNWKVYEYGELSPPDFLDGLDIFLYFTHPNWVESFGRVIIEAMAAGLPVILDPAYRPLIGDGALYAEPKDVKGLIDTLKSDSSFYLERSRASLESVRARFGYSAHIDRVCKLVDKHSFPSTPSVPDNLTTMDPETLRAQVSDWKSGKDADVCAAVKKLLKVAEEAVQRGPYSVVDKLELPPSGDKHDYWHPAPYWWPNPETKDGLPYIRRDGERVPGTHLYESGSEKFDRTRLQRMFDDTYVVTVAWVFTGDDQYLRKAVSNILTFFVDEKTRMNPNLSYAQAKKGHNNNKGSATGIIELKDFYFLVDCFRILEQDSEFRMRLPELKSWLGRYTNWLLSSRQGLKEMKAKNNHGTYYDLHVASIAGYMGDLRTVEFLYDTSRDRVGYQVDTDGSLPEEITRTTSAHYCAYTLQGWLNLLYLYRRLGVVLEKNVKEKLGKSVNWFVSTYGSGWQYEQIDEFDSERLMPLLAISQKLGLLDSGVQMDSSPCSKPMFYPHDGIKPFWNIG